MSKFSRQIADLRHVIRDVDLASDVTVVVVGDFMLDRYMWGSISRISPEAPVPVVNIISETIALGGAGNVVANLRALGATAIPVGVVGNDLAGSRMRELLAELDVDLNGLVSTDSLVTTEKTRVIVQHQNVLRLDREIREKVESKILETQLISVLQNADVCVVSDYGKGVCSSDLMDLVVATAKQFGIPVVVDPKGRKFEKYRGATCITPNMSEFSQVVDIDLTTEADIESAGGRLRAQLDLGNVLVTRSAEGMTLISPDSAEHIEVTGQDVYDVTGAGDTVTASLAWCMALGIPISAAARVANLAAGIAVRKVGVAVVSKSEILAEINSDGVSESVSKILTLDQLIDQLARWKESGDDIVFTNGCFDILHPGHVGLFESAKSQGDRLIVGLNSDESTRRLKGPERPINPIGHRTTVVAALGAVDAVVIFEEDTPLELIEKIVPDVLVKGADYSADEVVGAEYVINNGGRLHLEPLLEDHSTTGLVEKMMRSSATAAKTQ